MVALGEGDQHPDPPHPLALLPACRERPNCYAAKQADEFPSPHGI